MVPVQKAVRALIEGFTFPLMKRSVSVPGIRRFRILESSRLSGAMSCLLLVISGSAHASMQCTQSALGPAGSKVSEEGANPVAARNYLYTGYRSGGTVAVFASADGGATLGRAITLWNGSTVSDLRLAAAGRKAYAVWIAGGTLYFSASYDHGRSWSAPLSFGPVAGPLPNVSADKLNVHIVYIRRDGTVAVVSSADGGRSFGIPVPVGNGKGEEVVVSHWEDVYVAWEARTGLNGVKGDALFAFSHDGGHTFTTRDVSNQYGYFAHEPILALSPHGSRVDLVWRTSSPDNGVFIKSTDGGRTFTPPVWISDWRTVSRMYMVADDGNRIYATLLHKVGIHGTPDYEVELAISVAGQHWSPKPISGFTGVSRIVGDQYRPMPHVVSDGVLNIAGEKSDGIYLWQTTGGAATVKSETYLGPGVLAATQGSAVVWQSPSGVMYAHCTPLSVRHTGTLRAQ